MTEALLQYVLLSNLLAMQLLNKSAIEITFLACPIKFNIWNKESSKFKFCDYFFF